MRFTLILLIILTVAGCTQMPAAEPKSSVDYVALEQDVWQDFFTERYPGEDGGYVHLKATTGTDTSYQELSDELNGYISKILKDLSPSTIANFVTANAKRFPRRWALFDC